MNLTYLIKNKFYKGQHKNKTGLFLYGLIFILGLILRLYKLGQRSLWFDEADVVLDSTGLINSLEVLKFHNPGIFYKIFVFYWRHVSPYIHEWLIRLPSVIFAIGAIFLIYKLAVLFFNNNRIGIISSLLLSISSLHIHYSQEATPYSFLVFLAIATVCCFLKLGKTEKLVYFYLYVILNIISIYTHPVMWFIFLAANIIVITQIKKFHSIIKKFVLSNLIILLLCIPWFYSVFSGTNFLFEMGNFYFERVLGWIPVPTWRSLFFTLKNFATGYNTPGYLCPVSSILFLTLFLIGTAKILKKENGLAVLLFTLLPIAVIFIFAKITNFSFYLDRYFLPFLPFFCITVACGIYELNIKGVQIMVVIVIIAISIVGLINYYYDIFPDSFLERIGVRQRKDMKAAAAYAGQLFKKGYGIFHTCKNTALPFEYYFDFYFNKTPDVFKDYPERGENKQNILLYLPSEDTVQVYKYMLRSESLQNEYVRLNDYKISNGRIFLVFSSWDFTGSNKPGLYTVEWMDKNYIKESEKNFKGITVYLYTRKPGF